ncbi:hypothetical protein TREES_T100004525 [Tupaia chinensis]|uniref:Uncharacterized protein n=1 Tax=Tupaia chinensis TaxID=246437 RepID=L9JTL5_TUPCH|nr:hypothetical protein TREES_T100004525 [Tupaia chinensis]
MPLERLEKSKGGKLVSESGGGENEESWLQAGGTVDHACGPRGFRSPGFPLKSFRDPTLLGSGSNCTQSSLQRAATMMLLCPSELDNDWNWSWKLVNCHRVSRTKRGAATVVRLPFRLSVAHSPRGLALGSRHTDFPSAP